MVQFLHELSPCFPPMFVCCSGDLVVHLLQSGHGGISRSEVILSYIFAGTGCVLIRCRPEGIWCDAAFIMMVRKIFSPFWQPDKLVWG